ncbi:stage II sporulation protein D [Bacillus massiliigorillae]|uniref:stage II sporulation protein D n=1 Tax=Bacillus massiliigorillae TaxID=1243664 RepID=UPI0022822D11|nr:stage II sporulation protein D [Bacillus massiliigorillae]
MKSIKPVLYVVLVVVVITVMIPAMLVLPFSKGETGEKITDESKQAKQPTLEVNQLEQSAVQVAVLRSANKQVSKLPLEKYIVGVVASEMPADFELEALKAQALTARTYIVNKLMDGSKDASLNGADVTDTVNHQVYKSDAELKALWGADYDWKYKKVAQAVLETEGKIITYGGKPITATFFSTSNGFTENSEAIWESPYPYLKSVESPWDKQSPKFYDRKVMSVAQFEKQLGVKIEGKTSIGSIIKRTPGKRVASVKINGKVISGKDVRETLDLKSTDFSWERKGDSVVITTKGYGHGIGMSQYGANGMAKEGKNYEQIVKHYYSGIQIASSASFAKKIVAQK